MSSARTNFRIHEHPVTNVLAYLVGEVDLTSLDATDESVAGCSSTSSALGRAGLPQEKLRIPSDGTRQWWASRISPGLRADSVRSRSPSCRSDPPGRDGGCRQMKHSDDPFPIGRSDRCWAPDQVPPRAQRGLFRPGGWRRKTRSTRLHPPFFVVLGIRSDWHPSPPSPVNPVRAPR